jgi:hypothetical protein
VPDKKSGVCYRKKWKVSKILILFCTLAVALGPRASVAVAQVRAEVHPSPQKGVTQIFMRNVLFRVMDDVVLKVDSLNGMIEPANPAQIISLDDPNSFSLEMHAASTSISSKDLTNLVNNYILPLAKTPIRGLTMTFDGDQNISITGKFHKLIDVPFEAKASVQVTPDGNMRMHLSDMKVAGVISQNVLDFLGIKIAKIAQPKRTQTFQIVGNDMIFPISEMFPPPSVSGKLRSIHIDGNRLNLIFGKDDANSVDDKLPFSLPAPVKSYIYFHGGAMKFGRLTMDPVDMELVSLKKSKPFEFSVARYYEQLLGGYSKSQPNKGLLVYMADYRNLKKALPGISK